MTIEDNTIKLKQAILAAVNTYELEHPWRSSAAHRQNNIHAIKMICESTDDKEELMEKLEHYFSSAEFYKGITDQSALETLIVKAVLDNDEDAQNGVSFFGSYSPQVHPAGNATPKDAKDYFVTLNYHLSDFISYAIDKYSGEKNGQIETHRAINIKEINALLSTDNSDEIKAQKIKEYIDSPAFTRSFNSHLKHTLLDALAMVQAPRQVATRSWESLQPAQPPKILIFVHGWHDSLNAGDHMARQAIKKGFKVITYDHRGHGNDKERLQRNISTDLLRVDFRKFLTQVIEENPEAEIALAAHSMGGAILASENQFINAQPSIKSVSLIAPAVMSSLFKMLSPAKLFYRNMHADVQAAQQASDRFGGNGPSLFGLLNLMRKAARALRQLFAAKEEHSMNWHVHAGQKDLSVNYTEFEDLPENGVTFFAHGDHALHFGRRAMTANNKILSDMDKFFTNQEDNQLVSDIMLRS